MDNMFIFCEDCGCQQEFYIVDIYEGDDCWKIASLECTECGKHKEEKIYN